MVRGVIPNPPEPFFRHRTIVEVEEPLYSDTFGPIPFDHCEIAR